MHPSATTQCSGTRECQHKASHSRVAVQLFQGAPASTAQAGAKPRPDLQARPNREGRHHRCPVTWPSRTLLSCPLDPWTHHTALHGRGKQSLPFPSHHLHGHMTVSIFSMRLSSQLHNACMCLLVQRSPTPVCESDDASALLLVIT